MRFIILMLFLLAACDIPPPKPCIKQFYSVGEKVIFSKTGESVRIVSKWMPIGNACNFSGQYNIRFIDGTEITADQNELSSKQTP